MQAARQSLWAGKVEYIRHRSKKTCNVIRILQAASSDRCGNDCVVFSQCQHFMNQVDYRDKITIIMMKQETGRNLEI